MNASSMRRPRLRATRPVTLLIVATLLASCGGPPPIVKGSEEMPASFGKVAGPRVGCPDLEGLYGWPWADGQPFGYRTPDVQDKYGDFLGIPLYPEAQVWVSGPHEETKELALRSRMVNNDPRLRIGSLTREWSYRLLSRGEYTCGKGWVELSEQELEGDSVGYWFGGAGVRVSARLATLADGSLAVGQRVRVYGRVGQLSVFGENRGNFDEPDRITWYWTRLDRIGATGKDAPPADAALSDLPSPVDPPG